MNSIEEDIKNLQEIINLCNEELDNEDENVTAVLDLVDLKSLRNLINRNKELEEFKKQVTEIENTNFIKYKNYIPVSLVEETIEEYKNKIDKLYNQKVWNEPMDTIYNNRYVNYINILQELLEKRK